MGNWTAVVNGVGCHHNGKPFDIECLAGTFVADALRRGHSVSSATVTVGAEVLLRKFDSSSQIDILDRVAGESHAADYAVNLGKEAYEAYCNKTGWKSLATGADLPQWAALPDAIREAWMVSAAWIVGRVMRLNGLDNKDLKPVAAAT